MATCLESKEQIVMSMTIRRALVWVMIIIIICSLMISMIISNIFINNYFQSYTFEKYRDNVENIKEFAYTAITDGTSSRNILNSYISDPIYYAEIYDENNRLLIKSGMMKKNKIDSETKIDRYELIDDNKNLIGYVYIMRGGNIYDSTANNLFSKALLTSGVISFAITFVMLMLVLYFISQMTNKSISRLVKYAKEDNQNYQKHRVKELNEIQFAIQQYRVKLQQKKKVKKNKLDQILHETKTPITIIKSQIEGMSDGIILAEPSRMNEMIGELDRLTDMLGKLPEVWEYEIAEEVINTDEIDYSKELIKIVHSLNSKFNNKRIRLIYYQSPLILDVDKEKLNQAIYNLLINCYKYTNKGEVCVLTNNEDKTITIKDTGIGMYNEEIPNIFKPYYRCENVGAIEGEGLGLSIVKNNVERMGGTVTVTSKLGEGTTFQIHMTKKVV